MCFYVDISTALQSNSTTRRDKFNESLDRDNNKSKSTLSVKKLCYDVDISMVLQSSITTGNHDNFRNRKSR